MQTCVLLVKTHCLCSLMFKLFWWPGVSIGRVGSLCSIGAFVCREQVRSCWPGSLQEGRAEYKHPLLLLLLLLLLARSGMEVQKGRYWSYTESRESSRCSKIPDHQHPEAAVVPGRLIWEDVAIMQRGIKLLGNIKSEGSQNVLLQSLCLYQHEQWG